MLIATKKEYEKIHSLIEVSNSLKIENMSMAEELELKNSVLNKVSESLSLYDHGRLTAQDTINFLKAELMKIVMESRAV